MQKINDIFAVTPNLKQLDAFLSDICGIYSQSGRRMGHEVIVFKSDDEEEDEAKGRRTDYNSF